MTIARGCALLACFSVVALGLVFLRTEQTRCAARIAAMDAQWMELRSAQWSLQTRIARMRSPQRIHDRVAAFQTGLVPPGSDGAGQSQERLASGTR